MTDLDWRPLLLAVVATGFATVFVGWAGGLFGAALTGSSVTVFVTALVVLVLAALTAYWIGLNAAVEDAA